ncbi:MAG TPA: signal peptidase II [Gemmatimonadales bacterium]|nr:signal peptidase II [Gemmatimonadales bacterium]
MPSAAERRLFLGVAAAVALADLVAKLGAEAWLRASAGVPVVGDWVQLRLVFNPGAAFGVSVGSWSRVGFSMVAIGAIVLLARVSRRAEVGDRLRQLACGLVAGGAAGNLIDRIRSAQGVVDFLDVGVGPHRWPTFNVADIGVTTGALVLAWSLWDEDRRAALAEAVATPEQGALP